MSPAVPPNSGCARRVFGHRVCVDVEDVHAIAAGCESLRDYEADATGPTRDDDVPWHSYLGGLPAIRPALVWVRGSPRAGVALGRLQDDLMIGVDTIIGRGYIDERNLFVYGGSGGGVLTAWIVGHTDRFTAAVSKAPVINWTSFVGTTDGASWYHNFEQLPWDDPTEHLRRSPLMYVGNVTTPTLLMTGERDLRTPMEQTEQFYRALKLRKVPTAMVRLTDGWHSRSSPPTNFIRVQLYLRNWFERFMVRDGTRVSEAGGRDR